MIERTVDIAAPPGAVSDVITDPSTHRVWRPSCVEFRSEDGLPLRRGSRLVETVRFLGRRYRTTYLVSGREPERLFAIQTVEGAIPLTLQARLARIPVGTRLAFGLEADTPRLINGILAIYLGRESRRLKRLVESHSGRLPG